MDKLTNSINPKYHKIIEKILLTDSITVIYNELLPSLPKDVVIDLYINIKKNLHLFTPEQKEKIKPIITFYTNIKFTCSTKCNPVNNPGSLPLQDKEYGTKKECLSKCDNKVSIGKESLLLTTSFLSFEDKLQYLIGINKKELISKIQERDIYNPDIIINKLSPLEIQYRPYVIITLKSQYEKNPKEYKNVKYLYEEKLSKNEEIQYDVIYDMTTREETIINIKYTGEHFSLVLNDKPLTKKETIHIRKLVLAGEFNQPLGDSLSNLTQLKELYLGGEFDQPLGDSLSKLTQLKELYLNFYYSHPLGDSLSTLTQLKELYLGGEFDQPLGDSLSKLTQLEILYLKGDIGDGLFNQPLGNSLSNLTQLKKLNLGVSFNQPLGNSLSKLTQLEKLDLGSYNRSLGNSLSKLTKLKELTLRGLFNHPLGDSLSKLTQLEKLDLGSFNHPLGDSLSKLTQLKRLNLNAYNGSLKNSLSKLSKLKELYLGYKKNQPLGDSLSELIHLEKLELSGSLKKIKIKDGKAFFSFKNPVNKSLKEMNFDQLKQNIKDLRKKGYKIDILSKMEDKKYNRKLLRKIILDI